MGVDNTLLKSGECQDEQASASCMLIPLGHSAHMPAPTKPSFVQGQPAGPYRNGYDLEQIEKP